MAYLCEKCNEIFKGEQAEVKYNKHLKKHKFEDTPAIDCEVYMVEYDVMPAESSDYSSIRLKDVKTGKIYIDRAVEKLHNTNINTAVVEKLIGKRIRITSRTEIIW